MDDQVNKSHKAARSGAKAAKKQRVQKEKKGLDVQPNRGSNPKAFLGRSAGSHKSKQVLRSTEKREHTLHVPENDKTFSSVIDEPPLLVGVVGPPGCGKSTLIRSMVKFYAHRNIRNVRGPVTVVAGRFRRITFMECPNTLSAMCDMAKVVDLVLLVIDGNFGFEMETFEFLSIAQVHGFPKVIGVVSHLDSLKTNKSLRRRKNLIRHRFWNEVATGAKLLTLAPMHHGMYRSSDVMKLHRLLVCMDTKPQTWRNTHSCVFVDRYEDLTDPDTVNSSDGKCDRTLAMYGYVRGHPMKPGQMVHIPGLGDYKVKNLSHQDDPCEPITHANAKKAPDGGNTKMRHLSVKQKRLYAPYSEVSGVVFDDDAVYIHEDAERLNIERSGQGLEMLRELQRGSTGVIDEQMDRATMDVVRRPADFMNMEDDEIHDVEVENAEDEDDGDDSDSDESANEGPLGLEDFDHLLEDDEDYDDEDEDSEEEMDLAGSSLAPRGPLAADVTRINELSAPEWGTEDEEALMAKIKNMFVTGKWSADEGGAEDVLGEDDDMNPYGEKGYESLSDEDGGDGGEAPNAAAGRVIDDSAFLDDDVGGATGASSAGGFFGHDDETQELMQHFIAGEYNKSGGEAFAGEVLEDQIAEEANEAPADLPKTAEEEEYLKKKLATKANFDGGYDVSGGKNATTGFLHHLQREAEEKKKAIDDTIDSFGDDINKKISLLGYFSGLYVRVVLEEVPCEVVQTFDPTTPIILGGLNAGEDQLGLVHMRLKRHRWYPRILKAQDPVILSVGWRRIQSQPIFATEDQNGRLRYLKYSPQHMHCVASFYGPVTPPNAGVVCMPSGDTSYLGERNFKITATGYTIAAGDGSSIVKKLKLTGVPQKIQKTTCFVKGMFNSDLEAAMFVGAKVKSVSGLRGMIKKVIKGKHGIVRCSFEDKLLASDIVFIRSWKSVEPPRYCAVVQNLLDKEWKGMRTMAQLRIDYKKPLVQNPDSEYKEIKRKTIIEGDVDNVPMSRAMRMKLPFDYKENYVPVVKTSEHEQKVKAATFVAPEPREVKKKALINILKERSEQLDAQQDEIRRLAKRKTQREEKKEDAIYQQKLKKAKKETARKREFASLRKSKAHK